MIIQPSEDRNGFPVIEYCEIFRERKIFRPCRNVSDVTGRDTIRPERMNSEDMSGEKKNDSSPEKKRHHSDDSVDDKVPLFMRHLPQGTVLARREKIETLNFRES